MPNELELWQFVADRLTRGEETMLLVVGESSGSSPGRAGYKMAVGADGELSGSIGGGVMEVDLVNQSLELLGDRASSPASPPDGEDPLPILEKVHRKDVANSSGMICSGRQTVVFKRLTSGDRAAVQSAVSSLTNDSRYSLTITPAELIVGPPEIGTQNALDLEFSKLSNIDFVYRERLGPKNDLYIVGGGHCALALSELVSRMDFRIRLFDDRPNLSTLEKNRYVHEVKIVEDYDSIAGYISPGPNVYVVVMTLGYRSDKTVMKALLDMEFKYFGVLGSKAKMKAVIRELIEEGYPKQQLERIHTPIGLPINSRTPEEIAISIAAEIIAVKNSR